MPTYVYKGVSKELKDKLVESMLAGIKKSGFPEVRAEEFVYTDDRWDMPAVQAEKAANRKRYLAERKAELIASLKDNDESRTLDGIVFKKGEEVIVPKTSRLMHITKKAKAKHAGCKMDQLCKSGAFERVNTEAEKAAELAEKAAAEKEMRAELKAEIMAEMADAAEKKAKAKK